MPVYEYECSRCEHRFELLVRSRASRPSCPGCRSRGVRKLFSVFGLNLGRPEGSHGGGCACGRGG